MNISAEFVKDLIGNKKPRVGEIELTLFENCDVACSFCSHEKKSVVGVTPKEMFSKISLMEDFISKADHDLELMSLHLVGGELLQDRMIPEYLDYYAHIIEKFKEISLKYHHSPRVVLVSNMLTTKKEVLREWLMEINKVVSVKLIASYDPYGRPITNTYHENLTYFKEYIANVNVVATKQTINKLKSGDNSFDVIYRSFPIFMDDFLPDKDTEDMIPSDKDYFDYLCLVRDRYPKLMPFGEAMRNLKKNTYTEIQFTTFNKCTILPDNQVTNYLWKRHLSEYFVSEVKYEDNSNMLYNFLSKNNCMSCTYFQACPLRCPVSWSWKNRERSDDCVNARFFDSLKSLDV